jgi:hypothetical protein
MSLAQVYSYIMFDRKANARQVLVIRMRITRKLWPMGAGDRRLSLMKYLAKIDRRQKKLAAIKVLYWFLFNPLFDILGINCFWL